MGSHYEKTTTKPLKKCQTSLDGREKAMRIEKPKRHRNHKVKQGAPPKLSASQKRKLVRLYVYTKLPWDDILNLVLHFGSKSIKKHAAQTILKGFLGARYDDLRPQDTSMKKKRMSQVRSCKILNSSRPQSHKKKTGVPFPPQVIPNPTTADSNAHDDHNFLGSSTDSGTCLEATKEKSEHIIDIDAFIDTKWGEEEGIDMTETGRFLSSGVSTIQHISPRLQPETPWVGQPPSLPHCDDLFLSSVDTSSPSMAQDTLELQSPPALESYALGKIDEEDTWQMDFANPDSPPYVFDIGDDYRHSRLTGSFTPNLDANPTNTMGIDSSNSTPVAFPLRRSDYGVQPVDSTGNGGRSSLGHSTRRSRRSSLTSLISALSKCSLEEKTFIKDLMKHYSVSTLSSLSSSLISRLPSTSNLAAKSFEIQVLMPSQSDTLSRRGSQLLDLPGGFITSAVNNLTYHIACIANNPSALRSTCCEGCCLRTVSPFERAKFCVPFTVMQFKQGLPISKNWSERGLWWVDRFGNTALHIAAALGGKYQQLQRIISKGVDVHRTNSAEQTFMHLLDPRLLNVEEMHSLRASLEERNFDFHQVDVQGRTFVDMFRIFGLGPATFAQCWLEPLGLVDDPEEEARREQFAKAILEHDEELDMLPGPYERIGARCLGMNPAPLPSESLACVCPSSLLHKLMSHVSYETVLSHQCFQFLKSYREAGGGNYLHVVAGDLSSNSAVMFEWLHFPPNKASHRRLIRNLLRVGVDINHYDQSCETPLMAHIRYLYYDEKIIETLLSSGANANSRNNNGETPAHIAIKLGRIGAVRALLKKGVNIHARDCKGQGLLAIAKVAQSRAKGDESLYAKISACMALAIDAGAIASPDVVDEWDISENEKKARKARGGFF